MLLNFLNKYRDVGLLVGRIGLGIMFMFHGGGKLFAGPEMWTKVGSALGLFGITFAPTMWGMLASCSEFFGGLLLIIGFAYRPALIFMMSIMFVATTMHLNKGDGLQGASHAIEAGIMFLSMFIMGPGKYSIDERLAARKKRE
ncbi:MAG: DoxX family protein [Candidatus Fischerbacteria bacterium RBG_13_37_8]|uniref:DoxX family protein n=1 Tax=Candidatus Fischerbacteria bacterium RBG_13_37_8 TaxID=1817863 RepID=A0A1F5VWM1_9BACT|nr:MAG: DoxX family protein [Candidatus Fischerbacteria bacterium RBG_13_37_8]